MHKTAVLKDGISRLASVAFSLVSIVSGGAAIGQTASKPLLKWDFEPASASASMSPNFTTQFPQPDFVPGVNGQAWRSDGFSSWVSAPLQLSANNGFTVQSWIALESYPSGYEKPIEDQVPASLFQQATKDSGFDVYIDPFGRWGARISTASGSVRLDAKDVFPLNKWAHVALSYNPTSGELCLYLNGVRAAAREKARPAAFKSAATDFQIAHSWRPAPLGVFNINGVDAAYDDVEVTNTVLSSEQIAAVVQAAHPPAAATSLIVPTSRFAADLQRPVFHAMPPANWTNEPHGLIRRGDTWHMFYQRTPNGPYKTLMTWGHMKSDDLVHWTDLPIALRPELQTKDFGFDMKGIWSGDVVTGPGGMAFAFYTSVNHSPKFFNPGISLAISDDPGLLHWQKAGPLIDRTGTDDFRDPYVWFEGGETKMIVGAALGSSGGVAYYRCANLASRSCWKRQPAIAPFAKMDFGSEIWEMPVFTKLGDNKYILEANPIGGRVSKYGTPSTRAVYWIGRWDGAQFTPDNVTAKMLDLLPGHLSPTIDRDANGNLIAIGIADERRTPEAQLHAGWAHTFSLPRVWRLMPDGETLGQSPLPSLSHLRQDASMVNVNTNSGGHHFVGDLGRTVEIDAEFPLPPTRGAYGLTLAASPDGSELTQLMYDADTHQIILNKLRSTLSNDGEGPQLLRGNYDEAAFGKPHNFHVFIDHSVVDVFINNAAALSFRIYPSRSDSTRFEITGATNSSAQVKAWRLNAAPIK